MELLEFRQYFTYGSTGSERCSQLLEYELAADLNYKRNFTTEKSI